MVTKRKRATRKRGKRTTTASRRSTLPAPSAVTQGAASALWRDRWNALDQFLTALEQTLAAATCPRHQTLQCLVQRLHIFGQKHFDEFDSGLADPSIFWPDPQHYPPETIFAPIIRQVSHDLDLITDILGQRCLLDADSQVALQNADKLINLALQSAKTAGLLSNLLTKKPDGTAEPFTALAYFQKFPSVRVIPYAPAALVGLPVAALSVPNDHLAIPHEVGHYVYWHGKQADGKPIRHELRKFCADPSNGIPSWINNWREEIFADVFGGVIAGESIAADFQERVFQMADRKFVTDDGDHPVSAVRPYIYTKTLKLMGVSQTVWEPLEADWFQKLLQRNVNPSDTLTPAGTVGGITTTFQQARIDAENVVSHIFSTWLSPLSCNWPQIAPGTPQQVATQLGSLPAPEELDPACSISNLYADWRAKEPGEDDPSKYPPLPVPVQSWRGLVFANGWTVEGANGGFNP